MKAKMVMHILAKSRNTQTKAYEFRMKSGKTYTWKDPMFVCDEDTIEGETFYKEAMVVLNMDNRSCLYLAVEDIEVICTVFDLGVYQEKIPHIPQPDEFEPEKPAPKKAGWPIAPTQ